MGDLHAVPHGTSSEGSHRFTWTGSVSGYFLPKKTHSQIHCFQGTKQLFLRPLLFPLGIYSTTLYDPSGWNSSFLPVPLIKGNHYLWSGYPCIFPPVPLPPHLIWRWSRNTREPTQTLMLPHLIPLFPLFQMHMFVSNHSFPDLPNDGNQWHGGENNGFHDLLSRMIQQTSVLGLRGAMF